ncbi:hypothetical protein D3C78_1699550 [compost metagenome]
MGRVSVVMIPVAAASQLFSDRSSSAACRAPSIFSTGSGSPITPVEYGNTRLASTPVSSASLAQVRSAAARPGSPVPALALPVLVNR